MIIGKSTPLIKCLGDMEEEPAAAARNEDDGPARSVAEAVMQRRRRQRKPVPAEQLASQSTPSSRAASPEPVRIDSSSDEDEPAEAPDDRDGEAGMQTRSKGLDKDQTGANSMPWIGRMKECYLLILSRYGWTLIGAYLGNTSFVQRKCGGVSHKSASFQVVMSLPLVRLQASIEYF